MKEDIRRLRTALLDLVGIVNRPQPDAMLIAAAGVDLDRALFPLLVRVQARGALGVGELADLCGRDYTTVSRQITKLEGLGLVARQTNKEDARIKEAVLTEKGLVMTRALDGAREQLMTSLLTDWKASDVAELARLLRKLADDALDMTRTKKPLPHRNLRP